ncbi:MAG: hypothetical protein VX189_01170, partial [Planctomycetota bacterium]|nr:hypothetical protein [Planctomycetota bacterium]
MTPHRHHLSQTKRPTKPQQCPKTRHWNVILAMTPGDTSTTEAFKLFANWPFRIHHFYYDNNPIWALNS